MAAPPNQVVQKHSGQSNYLPWILIGCGSAIVVFFVIVIAAFGIYYYSQSATNSRTAGRRPFSSGVRLVEDHGIQTVPKTWSSCTAYAPDNWTIVGNEQRVGMGVDLAAPDESAGASYGIVAVPVAELYG